MEERLSVAGIIRRYARKKPDKIALIAGGETMTYGELEARIASAAACLKERGVGRGSHVLSVARPDFLYVISLYAVLGLGGVNIPAENRIPSGRLAEIARAVDADFVISGEDPGCGSTWIDPASLELNRQNASWDPVGVNDECSEIVFTTGTTGKSKGVMLSSHCLEVYLEAINVAFQLDEDSVFLVTTPLNHVGGMHRIHQCMAAGSTAILMDGIRDLRAFFSAIHTYGVTHTYLPPASVKLLITLAKKEVARLDGQLKFIYTASAPFPPADIQTLIGLLPHTHLYQGYGSSETGSICNCCYNAPGESINSLGKPYPCVEVILEDAEGNRVEGANREGFIRSRSGMNMLGYYKEPELTAQVLKDGFIYSSDLMFFDERGCLHFAGRGDDVINVRGFKIAPTEVENCALRYPTVYDCACVPFEDRIQGPVIKLLVQLRPGEKLDVPALTAFLAKDLEAYKLPKYVEEVTEIARTPNGKMNRKEMIRRYSRP